MLFNSLIFVVFFIFVFVVYCRLSHRGQNVFLLAASYYFYGQWSWAFLGLLFATTFLDYWVARFISNAPDRRTAKRWLLASLVANLGVLGIFKYCDFFIENLAQLLQVIGLPVSLHTLGIVVPVGVSFYTFHSMSYTIDVYRGDVKASKSLVDFALFVSFFPQLVAGPIARTKSLLPQVEAPRTVTFEKIKSGLALAFWGAIKKVVIADNLAIHVVDPIFDRTFGLSGGGTVLIGVYAFAFQIYCDFSGYSDIATGTARCLGFELRPNFRLPYFSTSPSDFWSRWHISLSTWLRDYLYIPLGGNRTGHTYRNLILTMFLGGLWHGAAWTFIIWGVYHGLLLILFRALGERGFSIPISRPLRMVIMFHLICLSWLIFRAHDLPQLTAMSLSLIAEPFLIQDTNWMFTKNLILFAGPLVLIESVLHLRGPFFGQLPWPVRALAYAIGFYLFMILGVFGGNAFIYFQF